VPNNRIVPPRCTEVKRSIEATIHHFELCTEGFHVPAGQVYATVETPKGEFGVYLVFDGSNRPYNRKIRAPLYAHLQATDFLCQGHVHADVSAITGSLDIVFGEIDRYLHVPLALTHQRRLVIQTGHGGPASDPNHGLLLKLTRLRSYCVSQGPVVPAGLQCGRTHLQPRGFPRA